MNANIIHYSVCYDITTASINTSIDDLLWYLFASDVVLFLRLEVASGV